MSASAKPVAGFIGLGSQGGAMAARIAQAGYSLIVWGRRAQAIAPFVENGAVASASIAELGAACDVIGVCVVDDAGVEQVCSELLPAMKRGSVLVIHSTILPESCEALERRAAQAGILFLDAPVSGGGPAAATGTLTVMCGGSVEAFERAKPILASFAGAMVHLGPAGSGQRAKIVNNALLAANMGLAQSALSAGEALGIDSKALAELIKVSSGRSYGFEIYARLPSPSAFAHGAALLSKDVNLLGTILPDQDGADSLRSAAGTFLSAATEK